MNWIFPCSRGSSCDSLCIFKSLWGWGSIFTSRTWAHKLRGQLFFIYFSMLFLLIICKCIKLNTNSSTCLIVVIGERSPNTKLKVEASYLKSYRVWIAKYKHNGSCKPWFHTLMFPSTMISVAMLARVCGIITTLMEGFTTKHLVCCFETLKNPHGFRNVKLGC